MSVLTYNKGALGLLKYFGASSNLNNVHDVELPRPGKNEWGIDTLERTLSGPAPTVIDFVDTLRQGQSSSFNGQQFYLQTWNQDNEVIFPRVILNYKGVLNGIPDPFVSGQQTEQTVTLSGSKSVTSGSPPVTVVTGYTRDIRYITRQTEYRYIADTRPTAPIYTTIDVDQAAIILASIVRSDNGKTYPGNVPSDILSLLSWIGYNDVSMMQCAPVFGTPYFECIDTVLRLIPSP